MKDTISYPGDSKSDPSGFRAKARQHQSNYRKNKLQVDCADKYGNRLNEEDAFDGCANFYPHLGILQAVKEKFKKFKEQLHANMLRSEHIPFNFFVPIDTFKDHEKTVNFLNSLVPGLNAVLITKVQIEYAPPKAKALGDNTSFDTYIETIDITGKKTGVGIEVKYTERSYPYGKTEKLKMFDAESKSAYHLASEFGGIPSGNVELLRKEDLKQFWRNYLLGVTMVRAKLIDKFISVHLFPGGNSYQDLHSKAFGKLLGKDSRFGFKPMTFETFIDLAKKNWPGDEDKQKWIQYLNERYIVDIND